MATEETDEKTSLPEGFKVTGLATKFEIKVVLKGDKTLEKLVLHHYRLAPREMPINAPSLVSFVFAYEPAQRESFLLFLRKEADGRYAPVSGQTDPARVSVIKLQPAEMATGYVTPYP